MYTHRFPGPITHSSLSKYKKAREVQGTERELVRLAIVYKVVRNEHVAYHSRVYHFGIYDTRTELQGKAGSFFMFSKNWTNKRNIVI